MKNLGTQISEDGRCEWRNNGGIVERRADWTDNPKWEMVASPCPRTPAELAAECEASGYGYEPPAKSRAAVALGRRGGRVGGRATTEAKAAAARANGAKGGRPRRPPTSDL